MIAPTSLLASRRLPLAARDRRGRARARSTRISAAPATSPRSRRCRKATRGARRHGRAQGRRDRRPAAGVATLAKARRPTSRSTAHARDGDTVARPDTLLTIAGPARAMLAAERTALNFVGRLSGIATLDRATTSRRIAGTKARDLLHAQDHAGPARAGEIRGALRRRLQPPLRARRRDPDQGQPHRGRRRRPRRAGARPRHAGHLVKIEIEVDTLDAAARGARHRPRRRRAARQHGPRRRCAKR